MSDRRHFLKLVGTTGGLVAGQAMIRAGEPENHTTESKSNPSASANVLRVALMQAIPAGNDQERNLQIAESYCRQAADRGADILLMPEMWNIGYRGFTDFNQQTVAAWRQQATPVDGTWVGRLRALAKELDLAIAATYLQSYHPHPRNAVSLINRHGEIVLTYGKVHTCDFAFEAALTPGTGWEAVDLDTKHGSVRVGAMICFDREFPESARSLMLAGAEVVLTPNACLLDSLRLAQFQVRAYENSMAMVMTNYPAPQNNGCSVAFDAAGSQIAKAGQEQGLHYADIDLASLRFYRERSLWGNAWRRPHRYDVLTQAADRGVFQREDAFGNAFDPSSR